MELRSLASSAIGMEADHWLGPKYWLFRKLWGVYTNIISHYWSKSGWVYQLKMLKALSKIQQVFPSTAVGSSCGWETPYHQHGWNIKLYIWSFFPTVQTRFKHLGSSAPIYDAEKRFHEFSWPLNDKTGAHLWYQKIEKTLKKKTRFRREKTLFQKIVKSLIFPQILENADQIPKVWKVQIKSPKFGNWRVHSISSGLKR